MLDALLALALVASPTETITQTADRITSHGSAPTMVVWLVPVEQIADDFARDVTWMTLGVAADMATTSWALRRCAGCREYNVLAPDIESRVALKALSFSVLSLSCWQYRRAGRPKMARVVRYASLAINGAFAISNSIHAIRRR